MDEKKAEALAAIVGGEAWQSGGDTWLVTVNRADGSLVVFSGDAVCEYENDTAFDRAEARNTILLGEDDPRWVISDKEGNVFYQHDSLELGWRYRQEAEHEARGLTSRTGERYLVREQ